MTKLARRTFLHYLSTSPALLGPRGTWAQGARELYAPERIERATDAINVFDFHEAAKAALRPAHYAYIAMGTDDGGTLRANREGFRKFRLRVRRLVNVGDVDTSVALFGVRQPVPILIAPCGSQRGFHADGEVGTARAAASRGVGMMLSSVSSTGVEDVNAAYGRPVWFQLYTSTDWDVTLARVKRAERAGCPALVLTADLADSNREVTARFRRNTTPECQTCHGSGPGALPPKPMMGDNDLYTAHLDWGYVDRLRDATSMKLIIKGIVTAEDAELAVRHGAEAIIVSNHGGRGEDSGLGTIECLPDVVAAVDGRLPVICDSGFRRGTDIFKALALGANAIAIGRPYLWGLSAFGQEGVETVIDLLTRELEIVMRQAGTRSVAEIGSQHVV